MSALYHTRQALGLCGTCGQRPPTPPWRTCEPCLMQQRRHPRSAIGRTNLSVRGRDSTLPRRLLAALTVSGRPLHLRELHRRTPSDHYAHVRRACHRMVKDGRLRWVALGVYALPGKEPRP